VPIHTRDVNFGTAEAASAAFLGLGRKLAARCPHRLLPCRPGPRAAIVGEVCVGITWPQLTPGGVELRFRFSEVGRRALGVAPSRDPEGMPQRQPHCPTSVGTPARRPMVPIWTSSRKISQVSSLREVSRRRVSSVMVSLPDPAAAASRVAEAPPADACRPCGIFRSVAAQRGRARR
jgi:hypothetical protein